MLADAFIAVSFAVIGVALVLRARTIYGWLGAAVERPEFTHPAFVFVARLMGIAWVCIGAFMLWGLH